MKKLLAILVTIGFIFSTTTGAFASADSEDTDKWDKIPIEDLIDLQ